MNVLMVTFGNPDDLMDNSGTTHNILKALKKYNNVSYVQINVNNIFLKVIQKIFHLLGYNYDFKRTKMYQKKVGKIIHKCITKGEYDLVFATASILCSYYEDKLPIFFYADGAFGEMVNYYWNDKLWEKHNRKSAMVIENMAISKANHIFYVTNWAAQSAVKYHNMQELKYSIIYRGANFESNYSFDKINKVIDNRICNQSTFKFLFVGKEWERKGGKMINYLLNKLLEKNYSIELNIVGCNPLIEGELSKHVNIYGLIDRNTNDGNIKLKEIFDHSDAYFQPSLKECMGIAYLEACSFALPIIANKTGGVPEVVTKDNGILIEDINDLDLFIPRLESLILDKDNYKKMSLNAFNMYVNDFNWEAVSDKIQLSLENVVKNKRGVLI